MKYEDLLKNAAEKGLQVSEAPLIAYDGLICGKDIAIRKKGTGPQKICALAEEIGHFDTSAGNIIDQESPNARKQEIKARRAAARILITPEQLIEAKRHGCRNRFELAEHLGVTEEFLQMSIDFMRSIHGKYFYLGNCCICTEPFNVYELQMF